MILSTRKRLEKDVIVRLTRSLKGEGVINVTLGQQVSPQDIIGTADYSAGFRTINLAQSLGVSPKDVTKYLKRTVGQRIYKDELLAFRSGFLIGKRVVTSPSDGILDFFNPKTGELKLKFLPKKEDLPAGVYGIVEKVDKQKGQIIIRTQASIIHGMFGSGRPRDGILRIVGRRDELLGKSFIAPARGSLIAPSLSGHILLGGSLIFKDAITSAISVGVSGIIVGGINAKDYKGMAGGRLVFPKKLENDIGISIIVCEGFGSIALGEDIYEVLSAFNGRFVSMDANKSFIYLPSFESDSIQRIKRTELPPLNQSGPIGKNGEEGVELKIGAKIRIIGNSFPGEQGKVVALDKVETKMPSGISTIMVTVETKRRKIKVPVANCEIIL